MRYWLAVLLMAGGIARSGMAETLVLGDAQFQCTLSWGADGLRREKIANVQAWINGSPLNVQAYKYPRNPKLGTLYADLVGTAAHGGENTLVVHFAEK